MIGQGILTGDAFIAKLDNTGSKLLYLTYLGGSADDGAYDLAINSSGNAYVTGFTVSPDFPTRNALFNQISGTPDSTFHIYPVEAFVAELNTNGSDLVYSTYLGGTASDVGSGIAVDPAGYTYVTGKTFSTRYRAPQAATPMCLSASSRREAGALFTRLISVATGWTQARALRPTRPDTLM